MKKIELPEDYAIVLRRVKQVGEEDLLNLAESLRISRPRLQHIIESLQHKGLILVRRAAYSDAWIQLSSKGRRLAAAAWPQTPGLSTA